MAIDPKKIEGWQAQAASRRLMLAGEPGDDVRQYDHERWTAAATEALPALLAEREEVQRSHDRIATVLGAEHLRSRPDLIADSVQGIVFALVTAESETARLRAEREELQREVERLRGETLAVRDPAQEPPSWVQVTVQAADPGQRARTAEWIRRADSDREEMRTEIERLRAELLRR